MNNKFKTLTIIGLLSILSIGAVLISGVKSNAKLAGAYANYVKTDNANFELYTGTDGIDKKIDWRQQSGSSGQQNRLYCRKNGDDASSTYISSNFKEHGGVYNKVSGIHLDETNNEAIQISHSKDTFQAGSFTVEFYIKDLVRDSSKEQCFFSLGRSENGGVFKNFGIVIGKTGAAGYGSLGIICNEVTHWCDYGIFGASTGEDDKIDMQGILTDSLLSVTYDASSSKINCYINGILVKSVTDTASITTFTSTSWVKIGSDTDNIDITFNSIRIYGCVLTKDDIQSNYKVDLSIYKTKPTWEAYKSGAYLIGYFAGQDPEITGYTNITEAKSGTNSTKLSGYIDPKYKNGTFDTALQTEIKNKLATDKKASNGTWNNLADNTKNSMAYDIIDFTLTKNTNGVTDSNSKVYSYVGNYLDLDGYHAYCDRRMDFGTDLFSGTNYLAQKSFTFEFVFGDFTETSGNEYILQFYSSQATCCLNFYYDCTNDKLVIEVPKGTSNSSNSTITATYKAINYSISAADLCDSTVSIVFFDGNKTNSNNTTTFIELFINGESKTKTKSNSTNNFWTWTWSKVYLASNQANDKFAHCTFRCVRFYSDIALGALQIAKNYSNDLVLYHDYPTKQTVPTYITTANYGLTGFDNLLYNYANKGKEITDSDITGSSSNELNKAWEYSQSLRVTKTERLKYFVASLNDGVNATTNTLTAYRAPTSIDKRATIYDIKNTTSGISLRGRLEPDLSDSNNLRSKGTQVSGDDDFATDTLNGALIIQNSFYMRSKNKCADSQVTLDGNSITSNITSSAKLMVTADIYTSTLRDTDFCGIVIDYSDKIWNKYAPNADYSGYSAATNNVRDDTMYTNFDHATHDSKSAMFETGVGFNLIRDGDKNYKMRVFVGGNGTNNTAKYLDIQISDNTNKKIVWTQGICNFSVYREYTTWNYGTVDTLANGDKVYLVKFYCNKTLVALIAMQMTDVGDGSRYINSAWTTKKFLKCSSGDFSGIFKVENGSPVLTSGDYVSGCCNFYDWYTNCNYGVDGHDSKMDGFGTASGNILFAVHRENDMFQDGGTITGGDGFQMSATEEDLCRIVLDNIGYMDYHDTKNQATFSGSYTVNTDMTFNLASSLVYARKVYEPNVYFNRLAYDSTHLTYTEIFTNSAYANLKKYVTTGETSSSYGTYGGKAIDLYDFNASHGKTKLYDLGALSGTNIKKYGNHVNGVYFKDIADDITYEWIDFNGETMFTKNMKAIDYFQAVYDEYLKIAEPSIKQQNQIKLLIELIDFGKAVQIYDGYYKRDGIDTIENVKDANGVEQHAIETSYIGEKHKKSTSTVPKVTKSNADHTYANSFKSYNIVMSNYVGLIVKINYSGSNIANDLTIYKGDISINNVIHTWKDADSLTTYDKKENEAYYTVESGVVVIELPLALKDYKQIYNFVLKDTDGTSIQTLVYSIARYCNAKWDTTNTNFKNVVWHLYYIKELCQYYTNNKDLFDNETSFS